MAVRLNDTEVKTGLVRFSYLNVFQPRSLGKDQQAKYSVCLLIPKDDEKTVEAIKEAMKAAKANAAGKFGGKVPNLKSPLHDGDGEKVNGGEYGEECHGCWVLNASSKNKPYIVDRYNETIDEAHASTLYSGCYGFALLNFYAYKMNGNQGIACGLNGLQKVKEGESLGGDMGHAKSAFDVVEDEEDEDLI